MRVSGIDKFTTPLIGFFVGCILSLGLFDYVRDNIEQDAKLNFERQAADARHIIERRLHSYVGVAYGLRALFATKDFPTRADFHNYIDALNIKENYPGFDSLNYARHVRASERREFEARIRGDHSLNAQGYPSFQIYPSGSRPEYHVLVYLYPIKGQEPVYGRDIGVGEAQSRAQNRARDTGEISSSGRLVRFPGDQGFVALSMRLVTYAPGAPLETVEQRRAAFTGSVGAGFKVRDLMTGALDNTTMSFLRYRMYDAGSIDEASKTSGGTTLLFDSAQLAPGPPKEDFEVIDSSPIFELTSTLQLAGRNWEFRFSAPKEKYLHYADSRIPWIVLVGGLLTSALLFAVLYAFSSSRERAIALAQIITKELRESEANLARAMERHRSDAEQIRDLLRRLVTVQEAERRGLSANLHDIVGQSLSVLGMGLQSIRGMLPGTAPKQLDATFADMNRLLKDTMGSVRAVISDLRPPLLDDYGLFAAIEWHARQLESSTGLRVKVEGTALQPRPAPEVELALFRIAQEALVNVAKHASANEARIVISGSGNAATLIVEDDGRGVDRPKAANDPYVTSGWGMAVMRERAAAVGGAMRIEHPGKGTRIVVEVSDDSNRAA
jgi:signal transduction histidine kinase